MKKTKRTLRLSAMILALFTTTSLSVTAAAQSTTNSDEPVARSEPAQPQSGPVTRTRFSRTSRSTINFYPFPRDKWDGPVVADLDRNGYNDIITNEHGFVIIYWGEEGGFDSESTRFAQADTHGLTVADINGDGLMNIIIAQGGGAGSNPRKPILFEVDRDRTVTDLGEMTEFAATRGRSIKLTDHNKDGRPDIIYTGTPVDGQRVSGANFLHTNITGNGEGSESTSVVSPDFIQLPASPGTSTRVLVTDFNNDGDDDFAFFGRRSSVFATAINGGSGYRVEGRSFIQGIERGELTAVSGITEIDYDNDGDFDLIVTREGSDDGVTLDYNQNTENLTILARDESTFEIDVRVGRTLQLENLIRAAPTAQFLYVGKDANLLPLETNIDNTSGVNVSINARADDANGFPDPSEINRPGIFAGHIGEGVWRLAFISRRLDSRRALDAENPLLSASGVAPISVAVKNLRETPAQTSERPEARVLLLENEGGSFRNVTTETNLSFNQEAGGAVVGDFNNDGWQDFMVTRRSVHGAQFQRSILFLNNKGERFVRQATNGVAMTDLASTGYRSQTIDFDQDGRLDLITSNRRGRWHVFRNELDEDAGNYVTFNVGLSRSELRGQPHGAKVTVNACDNQMTQRVGSGGSYFSTNANTRLHFGLGDCERVSSVTVEWTDGSSATRENLGVNRTIDIGRFINRNR